jgi:microcystin-dependent protein
MPAAAWFDQAAAGTWTAQPTEVKQQPFHLERVGVTEDHKGGTVPYGFLLENGSNVSRTTYAKLFAKIGTTWGVGDGGTTFGLPDSRRRGSVGSGGTGTGTLSNAVGNVGGAETHTLTIAEMPSHDHPYGGATGYTLGSSDPRNSGVGSGSTTNVRGGDGAHNNVQPSMIVTKMIRWLGDI